MKISKHIDHVSVSFAQGISCLDLYPDCDWRMTGEGSHGWKNKYECMRTGFVSEESNARDDMPNHMTLHGAALSAYRIMSSRDDAAILKHLDDNGGRVSRLDVCGNIHGGKLTPRQLHRALKSGKAKTSMRKFKLVDGTDEEFNGDTLYIGSQWSEVQCRVYDKNAERKRKSSEQWVRVEFQLRDEKARNAHKAMVHYSIDSTFNALLAEYILWDNKEISMLMTGELAQIEEVGRKERDSVKWLLSTVAKTLAREIIFDENLLDMFLQNVSKFRTEIETELLLQSIDNTNLIDKIDK